MRKIRLTESNIIEVLKSVEAGCTVKCVYPEATRADIFFNTIILLDEDQHAHVIAAVKESIQPRM